MMKSLGEILKKQMKQQVPGWKRVEASVVIEKTNLILKECFGAQSSRFAQAVYFKDQAVAIACLSSIMAQEIKLNEKKIISVINNKLGNEMVKKVRYLA